MSGQFIEPGAQATFDPARYTKSDLIRGDTLFLGLNCFEPGQSQAVHTHAGADKFYLVLTGNARMLVGEESRDAAAGTLVWAPAGVPHGVVSVAERTILMIGMAPPPPR